MKPTNGIFWRWLTQQPFFTPVQPSFITITDNDIASQVIRQIPDDRN
ncbi:hypothetical protein [Zobellella aerophila]